MLSTCGKALFFTLLLVAAFFIFTDVSGQCAMCKAVAESNSESEKNMIGKTLNTGILYLMAIPYILVTTFVLVFYRKNLVIKVKQILNYKI